MSFIEVMITDLCNLSLENGFATSLTKTLAEYNSGTNTTIIGLMKGTVYAGYPADREAIVAALNMEPMQIQIGDLIARSADSGGKRDRKLLKKKKQQEMDARMAFVEGQNICIEKIDRSLINEISSR